MTFGPCAKFATKAHDEATFVDKVTGDVDRQQQQYKNHDQYSCPEHDAHGESSLLTQICRRDSEASWVLAEWATTSFTHTHPR